MNINGKTTIYKNQYGYTTSISNKKEDGTYENMFIQVNFKKGVEVEHKTKIDVKNGFMSFYTNKNEQQILKLIITEFDIVDDSTFLTIDDSDTDLPF